MRRRDWRVLVLALGLVLLTQLGTKADEPKVEGDLKAMQGTWVSKDDSGESTWVFKGDKVSLKTPTRAYEIVIKLDPKADPKSIDLHATADSPNAKDYKAPGIYKFDGADALTICFGEGDNRPKEFKADFMSTFLFEMKRKK